MENGHLNPTRSEMDHDHGLLDMEASFEFERAWRALCEYSWRTAMPTVADQQIGS